MLNFRRTQFKLQSHGQVSSMPPSIHLNAFNICKEILLEKRTVYIWTYTGPIFKSAFHWLSTSWLGLRAVHLYFGTDSLQRFNSSFPLPVWVFIYGGKRQFGDAAPYKYGPEYIMDKPVIFIAMSYRMGALGESCALNECNRMNRYKDYYEKKCVAL